MSSNFRYTLIKVFKNYQMYVPELESVTILEAIIQICDDYIDTNTCSKACLNRKIEKVRDTHQDIPEHMHELFAAILLLIQLYLRYPKGIVKDDELRETLKELRFSSSCTEDLVKILHHQRDVLTRNYREMRNLRSAPKRMIWRINISVSRSTMPFPTVIIHIKKADGGFQSFEMNMAMFH
ncbi:uncharacterized protein LOC129719187 [Wyeomyia smithii]|uniref:uncharacterized protein LOC129719187 n=1 Tax=Wyeomyia smithii TaxID=174621 RepID=UPI0024680C62|nr:uncharacterized protein LOC129719187 [Wyeomyia smithii]